MKMEPVIAFCKSSCNAATGLPLPLDLMDQDVGIPRGFTREFVEEIEATLAKDSDLDKFELETRFSSLNPQKGE
jgi:poly(3-hydroxyalkanoate) synthetase